MRELRKKKLIGRIISIATSLMLALSAMLTFTTIKIGKETKRIEKSLDNDLEDINKSIDKLEKEIIIEEQRVDELEKNDTDTSNRLDKVENELYKKQEEKTDTLKNKIQNNTVSDKIALEYFETTKNDVNNIFDRENVEIYKESIIEAFIYLTDFIFFNKDIEGIKFKDLTEETKKTIVETYVEIDELIMKLYPNYKESMDSKYDDVKEFLEEIYENGRDKLNSNLSEDNKESLNEVSTEIKEVMSTTGDFVGGIYNGTKTKVKTWYKEFKENH